VQALIAAGSFPMKRKDRVAQPAAGEMHCRGRIGTRTRRGQKNIIAGAVVGQLHCHVRIGMPMGQAREGTDKGAGDVHSQKSLKGWTCLNPDDGQLELRQCPGELAPTMGY
jgi:hypothetical protein